MGLFAVHPLLGARNCIGTVNYAYALSQPLPQAAVVLATVNFGTNCEFWYRGYGLWILVWLAAVTTLRLNFRFELWVYWSRYILVYITDNSKMASNASIVNCKIAKITPLKYGSLWAGQHRIAEEVSYRNDSQDIFCWISMSNWESVDPYQWATEHRVVAYQGQLVGAAGIPVQPTLPLTFHCYSINQRVLDWSTWTVFHYNWTWRPDLNIEIPQPVLHSASNGQLLQAVFQCISTQFASEEVSRLSQCISTQAGLTFHYLLCAIGNSWVPIVLLPICQQRCRRNQLWVTWEAGWGNAKTAVNTDMTTPLDMMWKPLFLSHIS